MTKIKHIALIKAFVVQTVFMVLWMGKRFGLVGLGGFIDFKGNG